MRTMLAHDACAALARGACAAAAAVICTSATFKALHAYRGVGAKR
jgi:hypothetical protein